MSTRTARMRRCGYAIQFFFFFEYAKNDKPHKLILEHVDSNFGSIYSIGACSVEWRVPAVPYRCVGRRRQRLGHSRKVRARVLAS